MNMGWDKLSGTGVAHINVKLYFTKIVKPYTIFKVIPYKHCMVTPKTLQELRMLSSVTINYQITKIVMNSGSQVSEL